MLLPYIYKEAIEELYIIFLGLSQMHLIVTCQQTMDWSLCTDTYSGVHAVSLPWCLLHIAGPPFRLCQEGSK